VAAGRVAGGRCELTPERWARLRELFDAALEHDPAKRQEFLRDACRGDESVRAEVEALLARHEESAGFLEAPVLESEARALARDLAAHGPQVAFAAEQVAARETATATARERRAPGWLWLLAAVFTLDCVLKVWCHLAGPEPIGIFPHNGPEGMVAASVRPDTPAGRAGLEAGDALVSFDGQSLSEPSDWRAISANLEVGRTYVLRIERDGQTLALPVTVGRVGFLDTDNRRQHALWQVNALLLLATALFIAFSRPRDTHARMGALALATLSVGLYFTLVPRGYAAQWRDLPAMTGLLLWIPTLCVFLMGPIVFTFFASFPRPLFRAHWVLPAAWLPALALVPAYARATWFMVYQPQQAFGHMTSGATEAAGLALFGVYGLASVAALGVNYTRLPNLTERRRLRILLLGGAVATLPSLLRFLLWPIPESALARALMTPAADYVLALLFMLFPLSLAYSVLRHRLFDIRVILRQGLQYALARGVLLSMVPLLALALVADLLLHGDEPLLAIVQARGWVYAALGLAALLAHALRRRWGEALDRRFFREQYDARRVLLDVATGAASDHDFSTAAARATGRIEGALHPEFVAALRRSRDDVAFVTDVVAPPDAVLPPLLADGSLVTALRRRTTPLSVAAGDGNRRPRGLSGQDRTFLRRTRCELLVPIALAPTLDEAVLALGPKRSEQPYTRDDAELLAAIAASLAMLLVRPSFAEANRTGDFRECPRCGACHDAATDRCPEDGTALEAAHLPRVLADRYHLERRLGRGGMGAVYEATDRTLGRTVAVKVIRENRLDDALVAQRFRHEARAAASLSGPNIVTVHDYGVEAGRRAFLVMERLQGRTLRDEILDHSRLDASRTLQVFRGVCTAVEEAHRRRLVHRDLKPENVFLARTDDGGEIVKVLDFGIAKFLSEDVPGARSLCETSAGMLVGTPNYLSPQQLLGEASDAQSDLWALAVTAYECLTGTLPFPTANRDQWRNAVLAGRYVPLERNLRDAPERWRAFFVGCLAVGRELRPRTASEFLERMELALA